jgi:hypothetical protein
MIENLFLKMSLDEKVSGYASPASACLSMARLNESRLRDRAALSTSFREG